MVLCRRLLTGLLALALIQFSAVAFAPAHAHEAGDGHGVAEVALAHMSDHADHSHGHENHASGAPEKPSDLPAGEGHEDGVVHVHGCPQFTPANALDVERVSASHLSLASWRLYQLHVSHETFPPLRPPRGLL
jgi:hypothetical protein